MYGLADYFDSGRSHDYWEYVGRGEWYSVEDLFYLYDSTVTSGALVVSYMSGKDENTSRLWHMSLGYAGENAL